MKYALFAAVAVLLVTGVAASWCPWWEWWCWHPTVTPTPSPSASPSPSIEPTIAPSAEPTAIATPLPYWMRGGKPLAGDTGPRFLARGACAFSAYLKIAELGNDEKPSFQFYVADFKDYLKLCGEYQSGSLSSTIGSEWVPVPNGKKI